MGNEQSSGSHGSTEGSQSGLLKDCVIDADPILNDQHWSLHHAQLHSTPMSVFISKDKNGSLDELAKVGAIHISFRLLFVRSTYFVANYELTQDMATDFVRFTKIYTV